MYFNYTFDIKYIYWQNMFLFVFQFVHKMRVIRDLLLQESSKKVNM